jgi:nitroreductase
VTAEGVAILPSAEPARAPAQTLRFGDRIERLRTERTPTEDVILKRRSVRAYRKAQVPEFMIRRLLEAGRFAPSAGNGQAWKFVVIRDPEIIRGLTETTRRLCKALAWLVDYRGRRRSWRLPLAKLLIRARANDFHPVPFSAIPLIAEGKLGVFHGAPTVILILKDVRGVSNVDLDCGIAGQNMVLAAHSMGLGTCWVSFAKLAFQYTRRWNALLGIHHPYRFVSSLAVGFPLGQPDAMVSRPELAVDWFEDGAKRTAP